MKKLISTILIGLTSVVSADLITVIPDVAVDVVSHTIGGAVSGVVSELKVPAIPSEAPVAKPAFFYVRFAATEPDVIHMNAILPGLGIGYRRLAGNGAADISISGIGYAEGKNSKFLWAVPNTSYIHYLKPNEKQSLYLGGGLAWGGVNSEHQRFIGIIPSVIAGYEFARKSTILSFTEVSIKQPAIAVFTQGPFPGPVIECTVGIGF